MKAIKKEIKKELFENTEYHFIPSHNMYFEDAYKIYLERFNDKENEMAQLTIPEAYLEFFNQNN